MRPELSENEWPLVQRARTRGTTRGGLPPAPKGGRDEEPDRLSLAWRSRGGQPLVALASPSADVEGDEASVGSGAEGLAAAEA